MVNCVGSFDAGDGIHGLVYGEGVSTLPLRHLWPQASFLRAKFAVSAFSLPNSALLFVTWVSSLCIWAVLYSFTGGYH